MNEEMLLAFLKATAPLQVAVVLMCLAFWWFHWRMKVATRTIRAILAESEQEMASGGKA